MFLNDETTKAQLNEIFATTKTQHTDTHTKYPIRRTTLQVRRSTEWWSL